VGANEMAADVGEQQPTLGCTASPSYNPRSYPKVVTRLVGEVVCLPLEDDGGSMDPWHIHPPPLDQTDLDGGCRSHGGVIPQISDVVGPREESGAA